MSYFTSTISLVGAAMSIAMALGAYVAIYSIGGVVSPLVINSLTSLVQNIGLNVFSGSGILALFIGIICFLVKFQKNLVANSFH